jgi:preprotein translocase subunit SecD
MDAEKINLLAVLDDRVDSLKRMSPAIESEMAKAVQAQATAAALLDEVEALTESTAALAIRQVSEGCREKLTAAKEKLPAAEWLAICEMFAECERINEGLEEALAARHEPKDAE